MVSGAGDAEDAGGSANGGSRIDCLVDSFMRPLEERDRDASEFLQAVREVARHVLPIEKRSSRYAAAKVLERLAEPDRIIRFRVAWLTDDNEVMINRGWRVQACNAIGPYKGGLRFHPSLSLSVLRFLAFEQNFKNALTGLPLGGAKGGADFDPKGRSDAEIMRFCQAFMSELYRHIGPDIDVPAGDINVGTREIGYLFGAYRKYANRFHGVLTGKGLSFGGSELRIEATGFGLIHFLQAMLAEQKQELEGKRVAVSGAGNVATHAAELAIVSGARVLSLSDSSGTLIAEDGLQCSDLDEIRALKQSGKSLMDAENASRRLKAGEKPWLQECDIALPCATQNELDGQDVETLAGNGCRFIAEGANMPLTQAALKAVEKHDIVYAPGKAANSGGVALSGLEMVQNAQGRYCDREVLQQDLRDIMKAIHGRCRDEGKAGGKIDYAKGANSAAYRQLADAICAMGV